MCFAHLLARQRMRGIVIIIPVKIVEAAVASSSNAAGTVQHVTQKGYYASSIIL